MKRPFLLMMMTIFTLTLLAGMMQSSVTAQDDSTPTPVPTEDSSEEEIYKYDEPATVEGGDSVWTVNETRFINQYPDGFTFEGNISTTGGNLVSVSVIYSFTATQEDDSRMRGEVDPETGEVTVAVNSVDADGIPPWLPINYRWRVTDEAGTLYFSEWITGDVYEDNTRVWNTYENDNVLVYMQEGLPANIAETILAEVDAATPAWIAQFGRELSYKPRIVLFNDRDTFEEWRRRDLNPTRIVVGQAYTQAGAIVQFSIDGDPDELASIVVHEVTHLYQYDIYRSRGPAWWTEGQASYFETRQFYDYRGRVEDLLVNSNRLPQLFNDGRAVPVAPNYPENQARQLYDVGYTFVVYLIERYGIDTILEISTLLAEPENVGGFQVPLLFAESIVTATGVDLDTLESEWRQWLGAPATRPTLLPTPTFANQFPPTPTPFGQ